MPNPPARILVAKHGAFGDFVLATGPFRAIRDHHADAHITLLTTAPYEDMARASGCFDDIWLDGRPKAWQPGAWLELRARLNGAAFDRIYDLQTSGRTALYFKLLQDPKPEWSGVAKGCSHPHANYDRDDMHTIERQAEQLHMAGIENVPPPDVSWMTADVDRFELAETFMLLVPGGAAHRPGKRWPAIAYRELARHAAAKGVVPMVLGAEAEERVCAEVVKDVPMARNLCGRTNLFDIAELSRRAAVAVGNDTGPMHLITTAGCKSVVLFSTDSDPALCGQRGPDVEILRSPMTAGIAFLDVVEAAGLGDGDGIVARVFEV